MSLDRLARLRDLRETIARARLGAARAAVQDHERRRDSLVADAGAAAASFETRARAATRAILAEPATALTMARLSLQRRVAQEDLEGRRHRAAVAAEDVRRATGIAEQSRQAWSQTAKGTRKIELLRDALSAPPPGDD